MKLFNYALLGIVACVCMGCGHEVKAADPVTETPSEAQARVELREEIKVLLHDLDYYDRREEAFARLSTIATEENIEVLHEGYRKCSSGSGRWRAAWILGLVASERSMPLLQDALKNDPSPYVRRAAAYALGQVGHEDSIPGLQDALFSDENISVRGRTAEAIDQILGRKAEPIFRRALKMDLNKDLHRTLNWLLDYGMKGTHLPKLVPGEAHFGVYKNTQYKVFLPSTYRPDRDWPLLVSVHGTAGHPTPYETMWREDAEKYGFVVLAPFYDPPSFPNYDLIQFQRERSDKRLLDIISVVSGQLSISSEKFFLFGHSKGGQFVTRFILLHPDRIQKAVASASGSYPFPDPAKHFPSGLKRNPMMTDSDRIDTEGALNVPLAIIIGSKDLERRRDAAEKFMKMTHDYAIKLGIDDQAMIIRVEGGKHFGVVNQPYAAKFFFEDSGRK